MKLKAFVKRIKDAIGKGARATQVTTHNLSLGPLVNPVVCVTYHQTDVVTIHLDAECRPERIVLDSGGWKTATTRSQMNAVLYELFVSKSFICQTYWKKGEMRIHVWSWDPDSGGERVYIDDSCIFQDFLTIHLYKNGKIKKITDGNGKRLMTMRKAK